jgi:hypothetical protein
MQNLVRRNKTDKLRQSAITCIERSRFDRVINLFVSQVGLK